MFVIIIVFTYFSHASLEKYFDEKWAGSGGQMGGAPVVGFWRKMGGERGSDERGGGGGGGGYIGILGGGTPPPPKKKKKKKKRGKIWGGGREDNMDGDRSRPPCPRDPAILRKFSENFAWKHWIVGCQMCYKVSTVLQNVNCVTNDCPTVSEPGLISVKCQKKLMQDRVGTRSNVQLGKE